MRGFFRLIGTLIGVTAILTTPYFMAKEKTYIYKRGTFVGKKLCFIGDSGTNEEGQRKVADLIPEYCNEVFHLGDVVYKWGIRIPNDPKIKTHFLNYYQDHNIRYNLTMGNHDYYGNPDLWLGVAKELPWLFYPQHFYMLKGPELCLIALDTTPFVSWIKNKRYKIHSEWIKNLDLSDCTYTIAFGHHGYKSFGKHGHAKGKLKEFYERDLIGKIDGQIAGHDHILAYSDETPFAITSGSAGKLRKKIKNNPTWAKAELGFVQMIYLGGKKVRFNFVTIDGQIKSFFRQ